jgi:hypothetical protein
MKVLAIGLLAIIALGSGDLTVSANELRYNPPAKIILAECDQSAMRICRQQWDYVVTSARVVTLRLNRRVGPAAQIGTAIAK